MSQRGESRAAKGMGNEDQQERASVKLSGNLQIRRAAGVSGRRKRGRWVRLLELDVGDKAGRRGRPMRTNGRAGSRVGPGSADFEGQMREP